MTAARAGHCGIVTQPKVSESCQSLEPSKENHPRSLFGEPEVTGEELTAEAH
jgi:hypothetical protein